MAKPHWFPFYVSDFLSSPTVTLMTAEEVGGYLLLLCYAWQDPKGSLPNDDDSLRVLSRVRGDLLRIKSCFKEKNGRLYNGRLTQELDKAQVKSDTARKSNAMRWQNERNANALRTQSSSQSESESESELQSESQSKPDKEVKSCAKASPRAEVVKVETAETWASYASAYERRYGVSPLRNLSTNSQIKKLCARVPLSVAPAVAAYYVQHNDPFYVRARHPVGLLLRDCEGLHTQMASGVRSTTGEARNAEKRDEFTEQVKRVEAILKGGL